jgi:small-conductance mechanosensitive channel
MIPKNKNSFDELAKSLATLREAANKLRETARQLKEQQQPAKKVEPEIKNGITIKEPQVFVIANANQKKLS